MSFSRHPVALGLFHYYGRQGIAGFSVVESAVICLFRERNGRGAPLIDLSELSRTWAAVAASPLYFDTETGRVLPSLPGSEDAFSDLRFIVLDEPTQRRALFGAEVSAILSR